jgi:IS5 family transposase
MESIVKLLGVELSVPDYTTLCRRMRGLEVTLPRNVDLPTSVDSMISF